VQVCEIYRLYLKLGSPMRLATDLGPLRQFNLAHPSADGF
jgi:hypothetical protein